MNCQKTGLWKVKMLNTGFHNVCLNWNKHLKQLKTGSTRRYCKTLEGTAREAVSEKDPEIVTSAIPMSEFTSKHQVRYGIVRL